MRSFSLYSGMCKSNSFFNNVKFCIVDSNKHISQDPERLRKFNALESTETHLHSTRHILWVQSVTNIIDRMCKLLTIITWTTYSAAVNTNSFPPIANVILGRMAILEQSTMYCIYLNRGNTHKVKDKLLSVNSGQSISALKPAETHVGG